MDEKSFKLTDKKAHKVQKYFLLRALLASSFFMPTLYANTTIPPSSAVPPVITNGTDNNTLEILFNGQVDATGLGVDAIWINSGVAPGVTNGGTVLIDAGNLNGVQAVVADAAKIGVNFQGFGVLPNGALTIGAGSGVDGSAAGADAIQVDGLGATITNAGTIEGNRSAIFMTKNAIGTIIHNELGGVIQDSGVAIDNTILSQAGAVGPTLTLVNAGTIRQASAGFDVIQLNSPFLSITNTAGGIIQNTGVTLTNNALNLNSPSANGNLTNEAGGLISATGAGYTILVAGDLGTINNAGTIQNLGTGSGILLNLLQANNTVQGITNSGDITASNPLLGVIANFWDGTTITNNLVNSGNILGLTAGNKAIDFQTKVTHTAVIQNGGVILGDVYLAQDDATLGTDVFIMNGGTIAGNVIGASVAGNTLTVNEGTIAGALTANGGASNTFNLNGGEITGPVTLGNFHDTVNLAGTDLTSVIGGNGNDTFNLTDGSFTALEGGAGINKMNVNSRFTANGSINNVQTINVNNSGTVFTTNGPITNMDLLFTIHPGAVLIPNNLIQGQGSIVNNGTIHVTGTPLFDLSLGNGTFTNNALLRLDPTAVLTVQGSLTTPVVFTHSEEAVIQTHIAGLRFPGDLIQNGQLVINSTLAGSAVLAEGSFIQPIFTGFLPQGTLLEVVSDIGAGTILDNATLIQPDSAVVSFLKIDNPLLNTKQVQLQTVRHSYSSLSDSGITQGIANTLDRLALGNGPNNASLLNLLGQLDALPSELAVESAMRSLTPPFNYGLIAGSYLGMVQVFDSVQIRLEDLNARKLLRTWIQESDVKGLNFGDPAQGYSFWGKALGAYLNQRELDNVEGYRAKAVGLAFGADWAANLCTTFGVAGSFTRVNVDDKDNNAKDEAIKSWQATGYGWWEFYDGIYIDAMAAVASNDYNLNRTLHVNQIEAVAKANFKGKQYGVQADLGWSYANDDIYYYVPFARLRYIYLNLDDYQETGAGDLSLAVHNENVSEFLAGIGFRTGFIYEQGDFCYAPEMSLILSYDFENQGEQTVAGFLGGGPSFLTNGLTPGRTILEMAFGLNIHIAPESIFSVKYNLELRKEFCGNALYFQYNYLWD